MSEFIFPINRKASEATVDAQVFKVLEEAIEVVEARYFDPLNDEDILHETYDVIHACEGILRKYSKEQREAARLWVKTKCMERGDYARSSKGIIG